jgi:hypothetical protein
MQDTEDEPLFAERVAGPGIAKAEVEVAVRVPSDTTAGRRRHTQTVGQDRSGRLVFGTVVWRAAATSGRALGAPRTPMIGW